MDETTKKISRRDAMKLLGAAAGASVLANLPTKWQTPQLAAGVLPAHAQTSVGARTIEDCVIFPGVPPTVAPSGRLMGAGPVDFGGVGGPLTTGVGIAAPDLGISMHYKFVLTNLSTVDALEGNVPTGASPAPGIAYVTIAVSVVDVSKAFSATGTWTFTSPADGSGSCSNTWTSQIPLSP
jgi:hypothetical protein